VIASIEKDWTALGVYTPHQVAPLLGVHTSMVRRWVYGNQQGQAAFIPQCPEHQGEFVTFIDLVQILAIRQIRRKRLLSLAKVRATVEYAHKHDVTYPFARRHRAYVFNDDVVLRLNDGRLIGATGKYKEQDLIEPVLKEYMKEVSFNSVGIADRYTPMVRYGRNISLSPESHFGAPVVSPCNLAVETLLNAVDAEGSIERAALACRVQEPDVRIAVEYRDSVFRSAA